MRLLGIIICLPLVAYTFSEIHAQENDNSLCDSVVTKDLLRCASVRISGADVHLNAVYQKKISTAGKNKAALRDIQRAWLLFRDEHCNAIYEESRGGNEADIDKAFCLASLTEDRVAEPSRIGDESAETEVSKVLRALERAGYNRKDVLDRLASNPEGSRWQHYSDKNCEFLGKISEIPKVRCLARLNLERS